MAYQVIKGWPSEAAIDVTFEAANDNVEAGIIGKIDSDGKVDVGAYATDGSDSSEQPVFIIDKDTVTDKFLGLMHPCVLEVDSDHFQSGSYDVNEKITGGDNGTFDKIAASDDDRPEIGKVIKVDGDKMTILFNSNLS